MPSVGADADASRTAHGGGATPFPPPGGAPPTGTAPADPLGRRRPPRPASDPIPRDRPVALDPSARPLHGERAGRVLVVPGGAPAPAPSPWPRAERRAGPGKHVPARRASDF
ncbi:MAG: hypothetical protein AVDCRST_MAG49-711 [uncultured Thermomicrobiales bacterium]|uniref:Uncharacterized protein n=1 Tax=uncultured Thermomicrobiales bacterium TaxID=1645740 RepID=A0A6J4U3U9_9BACT|nr:MAG: hypothetical protein AVDCRST_MAG49-711 [uncultured Thermomicrobiales bacterium]